MQHLLSNFFFEVGRVIFHFELEELLRESRTLEVSGVRCSSDEVDEFGSPDSLLGFAAEDRRGEDAVKEH